MKHNKPRILVTRPEGQANRLCELIETAGCEALRLPAIEILDPLDKGHLENMVDELASYDLAVFISINAVIRGMEYILARREWPDHVRIAAVGASTAASLSRFGLAADLMPATRFSSEALLALEELQDPRSMRVLIVRGNGGREILHDTLVERGAEVDYAEVYRRVCPQADPRTMNKLLQPGYLDIITVTSNETLQNLCAMAGPEGRELLKNIRLLVVSDRQARCAAELGFSHQPVVADNASDAAIVSTLKNTVLRKGADCSSG